MTALLQIGLLAAIVGPRLFSRLDDAKQRTARLQLQNIATAVDLFRLDVGRLPTEEEGLDVLVAPPEDTPEWLGPYLARGGVPIDPWRRSYRYELVDDGKQFRVSTLGADGREGGDGADRDVELTGEARERAPQPVAAENLDDGDSNAAPSP